MPQYVLSLSKAMDLPVAMSGHVLATFLYCAESQSRLFLKPFLDLPFPAAAEASLTAAPAEAAVDTPADRSSTTQNRITSEGARDAKREEILDP